MKKSTKLKDLTFCALDLETTGINPIFNRIVEIGMVKFTLDKKREVYDTLINPDMPIPPETTMIHGITDDIVKDAPLLDTVFGDIMQFMKNSILVIQNPGFDLSFIEIAMKKKGMKPELEAFDTVRLAKLSMPHLPNHKLETVSRIIGIDTTFHRALADALACADIFRHIIKSVDTDDRWSINDLLKYHGKMIKARTAKKIKIKGSDFKGISSGRVYRIKYEDSDGNITVRDIKPLDFIKYGKKKYIEAYCYLRKENRYFLMERIIDIDQDSSQ